MMTTKLKLSLGLAALAAVTAFADAQTSTNAPAPAAAAPAASQMSDFDKWAKDVKNPAPWFNWGADLRLRNEYFNNALSLNNDLNLHEQDYFRFRERIWASAMPITNLSANVRLAAEQREWMKNSASAQFYNRSGFEARYGIIDNLYAKWSNIGNVPLTVSVGRQDIMFGDPLNWWLVGDGTPNDGSWTFFLDSIKANYDIKSIQTKLDVVGIYQSARPDAWLPTFGASGEATPVPYNLTEQNESGAIVYFSNKSAKNAQVDAYFIYKHDDKEFANGDNADIYTIGTKISGSPAKHWAYSAEGAYQFGSKQDSTVRAAYADNPANWRRLDAYGFNTKLTYLCKDELNNQLSFAFEFLSGDDPNTKGKDEMFDILWGRWPRWSEAYIYSYVYETSKKIGQMNNLARFGPTWSFNPMKNTTFSATYNALFAIEDIPTRDMSGTSATNPEEFSDNGNFRGHYMQTVLKHKFNDHISAHLWAEFEWMGNYYVHHDVMSFLRAEILFTF